MIKTNREIKEEVLNRVDILEHKNKTRKKLFFSCIPTAACAGIVAAVMMTAPLGGAPAIREPSETAPAQSKPNTHSVSSQPALSSEYPQSSFQPTLPSDDHTVALAPFASTPPDPNTDSFGEDEYPHVTLLLDGTLRYRQLSPEEYDKYGIDAVLTKADFGAYIGIVTEISAQSSKQPPIGSQAPSLAGSKVYYYSPAKSKAAMIVKSDTHCNVFIFDQFMEEDRLHSLAETYALFGADSADNISSLTYAIQLSDQSSARVTETGTVTDDSKIKIFYDITSSLTPYEINNPKFPTPDWLNKAWEIYANSADQHHFKYISIDIQFKSGMILSDICYRPELSTGYVEGMNPLTKEQNKLLQSVLSEQV